MCTPWQVCGTGYVEGDAGSSMMDRTCVPEEWTRQFGTASSEEARSVSVGSDGSVLVAGSTFGTFSGQSSAGGGDAFVRKYDAAGTQLWTRQFGTASTDYAYSVSVGSDGSVLVAGSTGGTFSGQASAGNYDAFVRKYDAAGTQLWTRQFGTASNDEARSVSVGSDGSVLVAGYTPGTFSGQSSAGNLDAFVRKYDAAGTELWTRQFGNREHRLRLLGERGQRWQRAGRGAHVRHLSGAIERRQL
jgi:WD40 repeat protein